MQSARSLSFIALLAAVIAAVTTFGAGAWLWSIAGNRGLQAIGQWLTLPAQVFTFLGDEQFYLLMIPAIYWCIHKGLGADLGVLVVLSPAVNGLLKSFIQFPRPFWVATDLQLGEAESFSTPSGHAQNSAALFGYSAFFLWARRGRFLPSLLLGLLIVLVALSRVYLGVHFAGDVLWGIALGLALAATYAWAKPRLLPWLKRRSLVQHILFACVTGAAIFAVQSLLLANQFGAGASFPVLYHKALAAALEDAATVAGLVVGLWLGLALEQRYVRFTVAGPAGQRIARYVVGVVGLFAIWLGLGMLFPREPEAVGLGLRVLRYALAMFWAIAGWPWLFVKLRLGQGEAPPISARQAGANLPR